MWNVHIYTKNREDKITDSGSNTNYTVGKSDNVLFLRGRLSRLHLGGLHELFQHFHIVSIIVGWVNLIRFFSSVGGRLSCQNYIREPPLFLINGHNTVVLKTTENILFIQQFSAKLNNMFEHGVVENLSQILFMTRECVHNQVTWALLNALS